MVEETVYQKLVAEDGEIFQINRKACALSTVLDRFSDDYPDEALPLSTVKSKTLKKIIEYLEHHMDKHPEEIEKPLRSTDLSDCVPEWDYNFVDVSQEELFEIILVANFLGVQALLDLTCAKVATMIKGRSVDEIREVFDIKNDFTPEEEQQVREENRWCEEC
ncbi:MAG: uncharacterized protein KVP18_004422 [Porospora cf. gigantea A]|uniref:uncharacterized protein n=1 Tax=Porospora cf. gigantea A TaxID=2853593 RepID=UPI0035598C1A|nr:MAG: hypothetical protein KVP18_004422 [Porospora cf. gigantea A]